VLANEVLQTQFLCKKLSRVLLLITLIKEPPHTQQDLGISQGRNDKVVNIPSDQFNQVFLVRFDYDYHARNWCCWFDYSKERIQRLQANARQHQQDKQRLVSTNDLRYLVVHNVDAIASVVRESEFRIRTRLQDLAKCSSQMPAGLKFQQLYRSCLHLQRRLDERTVGVFS
jgi:hypothetical protein